MSKSLAEVRKFIVTLVGFAGILISNNAVSGTALRWTNAAIAIATAVLTYLIPNQDPTTQN
jgi:hypothetical protein